MINKKNILQLLFLFITCILHGQVQNNPPMRQTLNTTGGTGNFPSGTLDYSIGECMVTTYGSSTPTVIKIITQGFQQPSSVDTTITIIPLKFYTGITPNGDGNNDKWVIDGISKFPENEVTLYNRWGDKVWYGKNYDNLKIVWDGKNSQGQFLSDATYFYEVEVDNKTYKGWVELTK